MKRCLALAGVILAFALLPAGAQGPDEKYVQIYNTIAEADNLMNAGRGVEAMNRYREAQVALQRMQTAHPDWHERVVKYRLGYVTAKLETLSARVMVASATNAPAGTNFVESPADATNRIRMLEEDLNKLNQQNAMLEAKLKEALSATPAAMDPAEMAKAEQRIKELEKERDVLKAALAQEKEKAGRMTDPGAADQEQKLIAELKQKLAQQTDLTLNMEKDNQALRGEIAYLRTNNPPPLPANKIADELLVARGTIASLQGTNVHLRTELMLAERRMAEMTRQMRRLPRNTRGLTETERQLEAALARIDALEANPVPLSPEEMAAIRKPDAKVSVTDTNSPRRKARELPAGAGPIMAEGDRAAEAGRFAEAEQKYRDVLRQDEKNAYVLSKLAAVQMEQNKLPEAERTLQASLAVDPNDAASLYLLGRLRFLQDKFDEALDAFSLSARLIPDEPRTQYFLGKTLIQKGNRTAAETALRKAVQLRPGWGEAHYSLAFVYATQQPPFKELAEWHYQKAISGGYPRNIDFERMLEEKRPASTAAQ